MAEDYKNDVVGEATPVQQADFFSGKLRLISKDCFELNSEDVLIVPCHPDILSGGHVFNTLYDKLGHTLTNTLQPYLCLEAGSSKLMQAGDLPNYKKLAMCILPELFDEGLTRFDRVKVSMCIADALDLAAEAGSENIVFTHWPIASIEQSAEILLLCLAHWIRYSIYTDRIKRITISLDSEEIFGNYFEVSKLIEEDSTLILDVLQERRPDEYGNENLDQDFPESLPFDFSDTKHENPENARIAQERRYNNQNGSAPFLFYSRNLSTSILSIEQQDNTIRQYRLSTTVREKDTHYFRCSRCDYLGRSNETELAQFRPKITVRDGAIASSRFPDHHPMCKSTTKEQFVIQQLDRLWKAVAIYETNELRRCYVELRNIAQKEADALYMEIETSTGRFPQWDLLKAMAEKYHNQYSFRLIKCSSSAPTVSGVDAHQYSEIRRVEDEIDGVKNTVFAWITEGDFGQEEEDQEDVEGSSKQAETLPNATSNTLNTTTDTTLNESAQESSSKSATRPHRIIRPTYKIKGSRGNTSNAAPNNSVKFRIVRPQQKSPLKRSQP